MCSWNSNDCSIYWGRCELNGITIMMTVPALIWLMGGKSISGQQHLSTDRRDPWDTLFIPVPKLSRERQNCQKHNKKTPANKIWLVCVRKFEMVEFKKICCIKPWRTNKSTQKREHQICCVQQNLRSANFLAESSYINRKAVCRGQNLCQWYWPHCRDHGILQAAIRMLWVAKHAHKLNWQREWSCNSQFW